MRKMLRMMSCVLALGGLLYLGTNLSAQGQGGQGSPAVTGGTRIAFVNMYILMKGYKKVDVYKKEMKDLAEPYKVKIEEMEKNYKGWDNISKDPTQSKEKREEAAKHATAYRRQIEDISTAANKKIMGRGQEQVVQLYQELEDAIQRYSKANGIHAVFHYMEPIEQSERYTARNIERKLNACGNVGASAPIFINDGMDISQAVLSVLNSQYPASTGTPSAN